MAARSLVSGTISFGLVAIPIRLYPAVVSERVSFHLLHAKCGSRIKYQTYCPVCDQVVDREDLVKGYEFGKEQYIRVTEDELEALEGEASKDIDIAEFVPLASVDPIFLDKAYFLGPDKGGAKPYQLLARALEKAEQVGLREVVQEDQIREVYDILKEKELHVDKQTWNRRYRGFMEKIKTGSLYEVAEVFRDLYRLKNTKTLSFGERRMLDTARTLIVKEIAIARKQTEEAVKTEIEAIFFSN